MNNEEIIDKAIQKFEDEITTLELCISTLKVEKIKLIKIPNSLVKIDIKESEPLLVRGENPCVNIQSKHKAEIDKNYE